MDLCVCERGKGFFTVQSVVGTVTAQMLLYNKRSFEFYIPLKSTLFVCV